MVVTWKSEERGTIACPECGRVYKITVTRFPHRDQDHFDCCCGNRIHSWNSTEAPSYELVSEPELGCKSKPKEMAVATILDYQPSDEPLVRRIGAAVVLLWNELPADIQAKIRDGALAVHDRDQTVQLAQQLDLFFKAHATPEAGA